MTDPATPPADILLAHADFVRCMARAALHGDRDVDDVVQDTWVAALQSAPRNPSSLKAWLGGIARRQAANHVRREMAVHRRERKAAHPERAPSAAEVAERVELGRRLVDAVLEVREPYRRAVLLRYYENQPPRRIAEQLGLPVETVRTHVKRGLRQLRAGLDRSFEDRPGGPRAALLLILGAPSTHVLPPLLGTIGGVIMANKLVVATAALLVLVGAGIRIGSDLSGAAARPDAPTAVNPDAQAEAVPSGEPTLVGSAPPPAAPLPASPSAAPRPGSIRGRVVRKGTSAPVPGVVVYALALENRNAEVLARSDEDGWFTLSGLPAGEASVFALGAGWVSDAYGSLGDGGFDPTVRRFPLEGDGPLTLEVVPCAVVQGVVLDGDGTPVVGATVEASISGVDRRPAQPRDPRVVTTGPDGTFRHDALVPHRTCVFTAAGPAHPAAMAPPLALQPGDGNPRVTIRLPAARRLGVRTSDAVTRAGVAGTEVWASWVDLATGRLIQIQAQTGEDGFVEVGPLPTGPIRLDVRAAAYVRPARPTWAPEAPAASTAEVEVLLDRGLSIRGRVVVPPELPSDGLTVYAEALTPGCASSPDFPVLADGTFEIQGLVQGRYRVQATLQVPPQWYVGGAEATAPGAGVVLTLSPSNSPFFEEPGPDDHRLVEVDLVVLSPSGAPLEEGWVRFYDEISGGGVDLEEGTTRVRVDGDGEGVRFEILDLGSDEDDAPLGAGAYGPVQPVGGVLTLRVEPGRSIRGHVRTPEGEGVAGVRVAALLANASTGPHQTAPEPVKECHTETDGSFSINGLRAGPWLLALDLPPEYVPLGKVNARAGGPPVAFRLVRGAPTEIRVLDAVDRPVPGARVVVGLADEPSPELADAIETVTTDAAGRAVVTRVAPGHAYALAVYPSPDRSDGLLPHVDDAWAAGPTTLRLETGVSTGGIVRDAAGRPAARCLVWWWEEDDVTPSVTEADENGRFRFGPTRARAILLKAVGTQASADRPQPPELTGCTSARAGAEDLVLVLMPR